MKKTNIVILVLLCVSVGYWFRSCSEIPAPLPPRGDMGNDSIIARLKNELNQERVTALVNEYTLNELRDINAGGLLEIRKEVVKLRRLVSLDRVEIHTTDTIKTILKDTFIHVRTDTVGGDTVIIARRFDYYDNWLRLEGVAIGDSLTCNYWLKNKFTITHEKGRKALFKQYPTLIHITNENPHSTTTGVNTYTLKPNKRTALQSPLFTFGVGVGLGLFGGLLIK